MLLYPSPGMSIDATPPEMGIDVPMIGGHPVHRVPTPVMIIPSSAAEALELLTSPQEAPSPLCKSI